MCEDSAFGEGHDAEHASAKHFAGVFGAEQRDLSMASAHASQIKAGTSFCPGSSRRNRAMEDGAFRREFRVKRSFAFRANFFRAKP